MNSQNLFEKPGHYCGVVGYSSSETTNVPPKLFYPLFSLQHRGQEAAGISYAHQGLIKTYKDLGSVSSVLGHYLHEEHSGKTGIGHVRYSTHGGNSLENVQPLHITCNKGDIALAHNGNISNIDELKDPLVEQGAIFRTTSDTEVVLHLLSRNQQTEMLDSLVEVLEKLQGAFSMVMLHRDRLYVMRDPRGFRPLYIAWNNTEVLVASETCALELMDHSHFREVEPGEIIMVEGTKITSRKLGTPKPCAHCVFEFIYFARPDSHIFGRSVYAMRKKIGEALADADSVEADIVMAVPDSGNMAALGYSKRSGIPFEMGFTRNHFTGRSFTLPTQNQREFMVKMKLHPIREIIRDKRIILVDDSLVRGTTSRIIVSLLRAAGAKEVHLRLSAPEIKFPCFYGIDIPTRQELISNQMDPTELARHLGADTVMFLPLEKLQEATEKPEDHCFACFSGKYPEVLGVQAQKEVDSL